MDADEHGLSMDEIVLPDAASGVSIHTGFPNAAADRRLHSLDLNQLLVRNPSSTFLFRIRGEQGITQGIFDGDIAVVDRIASPRGQDLVLWHDGEHFNLSRPIRLATDAAVWGTVTAVIHQYREGRHPNT
jgi:hypothetical protein